MSAPESNLVSTACPGTRNRVIILRALVPKEPMLSGRDLPLGAGTTAETFDKSTSASKDGIFSRDDERSSFRLSARFGN